MYIVKDLLIICIGGNTRLFSVNIENSNYIIDADYIVMALGANPAPFVKDLGLSLNK